MPGIVTFSFDDGYLSHYEKALPVFQEMGVPGCLCLMTHPGDLIPTLLPTEKALAMQDAGWEILCHSDTHLDMRHPVSEEDAYREIVTSREILEGLGFKVRQYVMPMSACDPSILPLLRAHYDAAFCRYTNAGKLPVEELVIERPVNPFDLHRTCLSCRTFESLTPYLDYVAQHDDWMVFYEHNIGAGRNATPELLMQLLLYCREKEIRVMTASQALEAAMKADAARRS